MATANFKGFLYFLIEGASGLPHFGQGADRVDSSAALFLSDMEEGTTDVVYDNENPSWNKQLKIKVVGEYTSCSVQVLNATPKRGEPENLGQVVVDLVKLASSDGVEFAFNEPLTLRPESRTGDANKDKVQGTLKFTVLYKAYKKKPTQEEIDAEAAKAKAERDAADKKRLEQERAELEARLAAERLIAERQEKERLAAAQAIKEANERAALEAAAKAAAEQAAIERAKREADAKAELEQRAKREAEQAAQLRAAAEAQRVAFENRQKMLLEEQQKLDAASAASAQRQLAAMADKIVDAVPESSGAVDNMLTPAKGVSTTSYVSRQTAPSQRLSGAVSNVCGGKDGMLYVANSSDKIYCLAPGPGGAWTQIPGRAICLAAADDGTVWCVNRQQRIYSLQSDRTTWSQMPGAMQWISIGSKSQIWGVDIAGLPHQFDVASNSWQKRAGRGLTKISVGSDGEVWAISQDNRPMRYSNGTWTRLPGAVKEIAVQNEHCVWATHILGGLYVWHGNQWQALAGGEQFHGATITKYGAWAFNAAGTPFFSPPPVDPPLKNSTLSTSLGFNGSFTPEMAIDGKDDSFWWSGRPPVPGDHFTVMLKQPQLRSSLSIVSGKPKYIGGDEGKIENARIEVSIDGQNWHNVGNLFDGAAIVNLPSVPIYGFRVFFTRAQASHVAIREFELRGIPAKVAEGCSLSTTLQHYGDYTIEKCVDGDIGSWFWSWPAKVGDNIVLKFAKPIQKNTVTVLSGHPDGSRDFIINATLSISTDGTTYSTIGMLTKRATVALPPLVPIAALRIDFVAVDPGSWVAIREIVFN